MTRHALPEVAEHELRVPVAAFTDPWTADLARNRLLSEGIEAVLADENLVRLDWFVSAAIGGVKVLVPASQAESARSVLAQASEQPEIGLVTDQDRAGEAKCPECNSGNLAFERWSRAGFVGSLLLFGFPIPIPCRRWRCGRCSGVWKKSELLG